MFGISWAEFLVILLIAVLVIPVKHWPDVAKFIAKCIKFIRELIWKISDAGESIKEQIDLEKPIDDLIKSTTGDILDTVSEVIKKPRNNAYSAKKKKVTGK